MWKKIFRTMQKNIAWCIMSETKPLRIYFFAIAHIMQIRNQNAFHCYCITYLRWTFSSRILILIIPRINRKQKCLRLKKIHFLNFNFPANNIALCLTLIETFGDSTQFWRVWNQIAICNSWPQRFHSLLRNCAPDFSPKKRTFSQMN